LYFLLSLYQLQSLHHTSKNCDPELASWRELTLQALALLDWRDGGPMDPSRDSRLLLLLLCCSREPRNMSRTCHVNKTHKQSR